MALYRRDSHDHIERAAMLRARSVPRSVAAAAVAGSLLLGGAHQRYAAAADTGRADEHRLVARAMLVSRAAPPSRAKATLPLAAVDTRSQQTRHLYPVADTQFQLERAAMLRSRSAPASVAAVVASNSLPVVWRRPIPAALIADGQFQIERSAMARARRAPGSVAKATLPLAVTDTSAQRIRYLDPARVGDKQFALERAAMLRARRSLPSVAAAAASNSLPAVWRRPVPAALIPDGQFQIERAAMLRSRAAPPSTAKNSLPFFTRAQRISAVYPLRDTEFTRERAAMLRTRSAPASLAKDSRPFDTRAAQYFAAAAVSDTRRRVDEFDHITKLVALRRSRGAPASEATSAPAVSGAVLVGRILVRPRLEAVLGAAPRLSGRPVTTPRLAGDPIVRPGSDSTPC